VAGNNQSNNVFNCDPSAHVTLGGTVDLVAATDRARNLHAFTQQPGRKLLTEAPTSTAAASGPTTPAPTIQKTLEFGLSGSPLSAYTISVERAFGRAIAEMVNIPQSQVSITSLLKDESRRVESHNVRIKFTVDAPSETISRELDLENRVIAYRFEDKFYNYARAVKTTFVRPTLGWVIETVYVETPESASGDQTAASSNSFSVEFVAAVAAGMLGLLVATSIVVYYIWNWKHVKRSNRVTPTATDSLDDMSVRRPEWTSVNHTCEHIDGEGSGQNQ
jgi:hypothetical protein